MGDKGGSQGKNPPDDTKQIGQQVREIKEHRPKKTEVPASQGPWSNCRQDKPISREKKQGENELDGVGPVDNRPSTDKLHHFVRKKK